jgi:hypothetical protein
MTYPSADHHIDTHSREYYGFASSEGGGIGNRKDPYDNKVSEQINKDYQKYLESLTPEQRKEQEEWEAQYELKNRYRYDYYR